MRYTHNTLLVMLVGLWVTSPTLLIIGSVDGGDTLQRWALWTLGPAVVASAWMLLWDHRQRIVDTVSEMVGADEDRVERMASAVTLALAKDRTPHLR